MIVVQVANALKPGRWEEAMGTIKTGNDLIKKHGGENVATMVSMADGPTLGFETYVRQTISDL